MLLMSATPSINLLLFLSPHPRHVPRLGRAPIKHARGKQPLQLGVRPKLVRHSPRPMRLVPLGSCIHHSGGEHSFQPSGSFLLEPLSTFFIVRSAQVINGCG